MTSWSEIIFLKSLIFQNSPKCYQIFLVTFVRKKISNIFFKKAQSGHTVRDAQMLSF